MSWGMYVLDDRGEPRLESDSLTWAKWFEGGAGKRTIAKDTIGDVFISTVFLGLDHNFDEAGPPLLWETMIFRGINDEYMDRYATREDALAGHAKAVGAVRSGVKLP